MIFDDVPAPSHKIKQSKIEAIAARCNLLYRDRKSHRTGYPVDVEDFADAHLGISITEDFVDAPEGVIIFAECCEHPSSAGRCLVTINEHHRELFDANPNVRRACVTHEVGHWLLRHLEWNNHTSPNLSLFADSYLPQRRLHSSKWNPHGLSKQQMTEICKRACIDPHARHIVKSLEDKLEPRWMYWQAENFAMCFLIPEDRVEEYISDGWDVSAWQPIYHLASKFGVAGALMSRRLKKLGAIEVEDGKPKLGAKWTQRSLLAH